MGRTFVMGDIHGNYEGFKEALEKSPFNPEEDRLILLGDLVDGYKGSFEIIATLLTFKDVVFVVGNHDRWFIDYFKTGANRWIWKTQGGRETLKSYELNSNGIIPSTHQEFFEKSLKYYIQDDMIFVHGGFNPMVNIDKQNTYFLTWDRKLIETAKKMCIYRNDKDEIDKEELWRKVFVGHTTTQLINRSSLPVKFNNLIMLDTGGGWKGKVTIMDVETEKYWQG